MTRAPCSTRGRVSCTGPCAYINDEVAWPNSSVGHQLLGPTTIELMPPPACPFPGHGGPSQSSSFPQLIAENGAVVGQSKLLEMAPSKQGEAPPLALGSCTAVWARGDLDGPA